MKLSVVFWNAAQEITDNPDTFGSAYCCSAIRRIERNSAYEHTKALVFFYNLFGNRQQLIADFWWANASQTNEDQEARRLALLFAHEIALDEEGRT